MKKQRRDCWLTPERVPEVTELLKQGVRHQVLAQMYGVGVKAISKMICRHLPELANRSLHGHKTWSRERIQRLRSFLEQGLQHRQIGEIFGVTPDAIKAAIQTKLPGCRRTRPEVEWTPKRIEQLKDLRTQGRKPSEIAEIMGLTKNAVCGAVHRYMRTPEPSVPGRMRGPARKRLAALAGHRDELAVASKNGLSSGKIAKEHGVPRTTAASYMNYHGLYAKPKMLIPGSIRDRPAVRVTLPKLSIQRRNDFSDADVRAGMADRAWTERELAE